MDAAPTIFRGVIFGQKISTIRAKPLDFLAKDLGPPNKTGPIRLMYVSEVYPTPSPPPNPAGFGHNKSFTPLLLWFQQNLPKRDTCWAPTARTSRRSGRTAPSSWGWRGSSYPSTSPSSLYSSSVSWTRSPLFYRPITASVITLRREGFQNLNFECRFIR